MGRTSGHEKDKRKEKGKKRTPSPKRRRSRVPRRPDQEELAAAVSRPDFHRVAHESLQKKRKRIVEAQAGAPISHRITLGQQRLRLAGAQVEQEIDDNERADQAEDEQETDASKIDYFARLGRHQRVLFRSMLVGLEGRSGNFEVQRMIATRLEELKLPTRANAV